jgi:hypothetical protein
MASSAAGPFEGGYKEARQIRIPRAFQLFQKHFGRWLLLYGSCACGCATPAPRGWSCTSGA